MNNILINVNSKFADLEKYTSSNFIYFLNEEIKNIAYLKLGSIEFPTSIYNFQLTKGNTSFRISDGTNEDTVTLPDGNYSSDTLLIKVQDIFDEINTARSKDYSIDLDINTARLVFTCSDNFTLNFSDTDYGYDNLGKHLGFKNDTYSGTSITADNVLNLNTPTYYFLKINNLGNIKDNYVNNAFAKIIQTTGSFDFTFEGKGDFTSKEIVLRSPINLSKLEVQVVDFKDRIVDFNGIDLTFTLEVGYVYDKKLYEEINSNGIPNGDNRLKYYF
jgi:hypothetical protein